MSVTATPPSVPVGPSAPPVPTGGGAIGQATGSPSLSAISGPLFASSGLTTTASTWVSTTGASANNIVVYGNAPAPRKPRRPREKRQIPLYTAGLEAKLNKCLDQDPSKLLRYISRKVGQHPKMDDSNPSETVYEYNTLFQYVVSNSVAWGAQVNGTFPPVDKHTVKFFARLVLRNDGTLREYEVRMGGAKT